MNIDKREIQRILCIKLKGIGDVILTTIVLDNLRAAFPEARIDFLTEPPSLPAIEFIGTIDTLLTYQSKERFGGLYTILEVARNRYDLVLDFYSNPRTALITFLSGAKYRAGYPYRGRTYAYNVFGPPERDKFHSADLHLELLKATGIPCVSRDLHFGLSLDDRKFADEYFAAHFADGKPVVMVSPSGGWDSKKCPPEKLAELGLEIVQKYDVHLFVVWGPGDKAEADEICKLVRKNATLAPPTTIRESAALMSKAAFVIANDSGPMHIAAGLGVPVFALFGPTNPKLQGPYGVKHEVGYQNDLHCITCNLLSCPTKQECFTQLQTGDLMRQIHHLIVKNSLTIEAAHESN